MRPFCLSPILSVGIPKLGTSMIPLEEFPITAFTYLKQEKYVLDHGNLNGYDGTSECEVCGAVLTGEAKTAQYAYACGEEGRKIHHLHVGNTHFCNLDCFEKYKAKYNQQLNTPKYQ